MAKPPRKTGKDRLTRDANAVTEERNREAARVTNKAAKKKIQSPGIHGELEEGLRESFPASDPLTATRPGGAKEDAREASPRSPSPGPSRQSKKTM